MEAHVIICGPTGQQTLSIEAESFSPFVVLSLRGTAVTLTNDESRKVADALRAAELRLPYDSPM
jgi:hypothetical protein